MNASLVGQSFTHRGVALRVQRITADGLYEVWSVHSCGVWFATPEQLHAAGLPAA